MHRSAKASSIRMIAIDMDGTLLGEDGQVSPRNRAALLAAQSAGIEIVIATGRRHSYAMRLLRPLGLAHSCLLISSNGAVTRTLGSIGENGIPSRFIARTHISPATTFWLCDHLRGEGDQNFRNSLVLTFDRVGPDGDDTRGALVVEQFEELNSNIGRWMASNEPYIAHINPIELCLKPEEPDSPHFDHHGPIQAMLCGTVEQMSRAEARLLEHPGVQSSVHATGRSGRTTLGARLQAKSTESTGQIAGSPSMTASLSGASSPASTAPEPILTLQRTVYPARNLSILDILPPNCSKGTALLVHAASRGINPADILAIGDNWNDVSMLEIAGHAVLMANAPDDLKSLAHARNWRIGLANTAHGVAEAIESCESLDDISFIPGPKEVSYR